MAIELKNTPHEQALELINKFLPKNITVLDDALLQTKRSSKLAVSLLIQQIMTYQLKSFEDFDTDNEIRFWTNVETEIDNYNLDYIFQTRNQSTNQLIN